MEWREVVGYEGLYKVSNTGEIKSPEGKITYTKRHGRRVWKERIMKQKKHKDGTCRVNLWKDGKPSTHLVHRLVAYAFIPLEEDKEFINHKDGSRLNNHVDNLEWCTYKENANHAFDTGLMSSNEKVKLINKETGETYYFRSKAKASEFLGRNKGYISDKLIKGVSGGIEGYDVVEINESMEA